MGTAVVLIALIAVCGLIIRKMHNDKKSGKNSCNGNCGSCSGCH